MSDIQINLDDKSKKRIVWLAQNVYGSLFTMNDFPFTYIDHTDIREIVSDANYIPKSMACYGDIEDVLVDMQLMYYLQFSPTKYATQQQPTRYLRAYS